ncbi:MAG: 5-bromo-4-chloroindolyl phosphate hydrolysis family protein [Firmicutes bacterium]|nr:5-bromo-4-chloroindolyl phosphate hydrolysis family protein [Bacillota bacterium]
MGLLLLGGIAFVVIIGAIVVAGFKSADVEAEKRHCKGIEIKDAAGLAAEDEKILKISRQLIVDERMLSTRINNNEVRALLTPALDKAEDILKVLKSDPKEIQSTKQFLNYYIPTLDEIIKKFIKLEASGVDITQDTEKIKTYLTDINKAMDRQYNNLFDDDKLDLSVEMEAMTLAFKRDGLITESEYITEEAPKGIELTL